MSRLLHVILVFLIGAVLVVAALAAITAVGSVAIEHRYPPAGRFVDVAGGRLHVLDLGQPNDEAPVVLLHGAAAILKTCGWL